MPAEIRDAPDGIERAVWMGERMRRFRPLVTHPWFPAIFGRMAAGSSTWRIARWLMDELPVDDPLRQIGFDALNSRLKRFRRLVPDALSGKTTAWSSRRRSADHSHLRPSPTPSNVILREPTCGDSGSTTCVTSPGRPSCLGPGTCGSPRRSSGTPRPS
jgi:hypothetical protein